MTEKKLEVVSLDEAADNVGAYLMAKLQVETICLALYTGAMDDADTNVSARFLADSFSRRYDVNTADVIAITFAFLQELKEINWNFTLHKRGESWSPKFTVEEVA